MQPSTKDEEWVAPAESDLPYQVTLSLLGADILARCVHERCCDGIANYFSAAVTEPWKTPDVVVDCSWPRAGRMLFRSRPADAGGPLPGVWVHDRGAGSGTGWPHRMPPVPPLAAEPLRDRFVALHGAALASPAGQCLLVLGHRESGKTTTTLELVTHHGWSMLTDETVFLHRRSALVEPFPQAMSVWRYADDQRLKIIRPASQLCGTIADGAALATHVVCLVNDPTATTRIETLSQSDAFPAILEHMLEAGSSWHESVITVALMSRSVPVMRLRHNGFSDLTQFIPMMLAHLQ